MKKNKVKKLCTLGLAAMFILTAFIPNQEIHAKGVTKKTVTIHVGQKKKDTAKAEECKENQSKK